MDRAIVAQHEVAQEHCIYELYLYIDKYMQ